ncbi:unnamed protein product, partial [Iphiclides podalirius]
MRSWIENCHVYGGRDLQSGCEGGTWLAVSISMKKVGLLLNLPSTPKNDSKSRGKVVENFINSHLQTNEFIESMKEYFQKCNEFVLVAVEFGDSIPVVQTYNNAINELKQWQAEYLGFSNSLPENPLTKVKVGKCKLQEICSKFNKIIDKEKLIDELVAMLKSEERNLPDQQLEERKPLNYKELSSIFVKIPKGGYGTRAHTILLVTKTGKVDLIEISMKTPIDPFNPFWERTEFEFDI